MFIQKNLPVNINVEIYTLRLLFLLQKLAPKLRTSCLSHIALFDTLDIVHTGGHAVAISEIHIVTPSTTFWLILRILQISQEMQGQFSLVFVCKVYIDADIEVRCLSLINCWNYTTTKWVFTGLPHFTVPMWIFYFSVSLAVFGLSAAVEGTVLDITCTHTKGTTPFGDGILLHNGA